MGRIFYRILGRYFAGSLLLAVMTGLYVLTVGLILGVPLAPLAAIWAMLTNLIPQVGGFLGGSVFVVLALTAGVGVGLLALVLFVTYMSTENYLIQPAVVGSAVNLSPPATMLAAFVGAATAGVPGALVGAPLAGVVKAMYTEFRFGPAEEEQGRPRVPLVGALRRRLGRATG
jgi:predicted PurR-regulated permease PerM